MSEIQCTEEWRPVVGYEGFYSVSNYGVIRRDRKASGTRVGNLLKVNDNGNGYSNCCLSAYGKQRTKLVHVLVAQAFLGPAPDGLEVNHLNGVKHDNRVCNLEYVTGSQNILHAIHVLGNWPVTTRGEAKGNSVLNDSKVRQIKQMRRDGKSVSEIAKHLGLYYSIVHCVVSGKTWKHV